MKHHWTVRNDRQLKAKPLLRDLNQKSFFLSFNFVEWNTAVSSVMVTLHYSDFCVKIKTTSQTLIKHHTVKFGGERKSVFKALCCRRYCKVYIFLIIRLCETVFSVHSNFINKNSCVLLYWFIFSNFMQIGLYCCNFTSVIFYFVVNLQQLWFILLYLN